MGMEYLLESCFAVGQENIHSLATKAASPYRFGESVAYSEHVGPRIRVKVLKLGGMVFGDDQNVARIYRTDVHEGQDAIVLEYDAGLHAASNHLAKEAVLVVRGHKGILPFMSSCPRLWLLSESGDVLLPQDRGTTAT